MRAVAPVFQVYQLGNGSIGGTETIVWWRMVSPNGRGLARTVAPHRSVEAALESIELVRRVAHTLEPSLRMTDRTRWRWVLSNDGVPIAESPFDLDRRVRCELAWRSFATLAPIASIDPTMHTYLSRAGVRPRTSRVVG
jgi:hypothetical protein